MQDNKSVNYNNGALPNNLIGVTENRSTGGCNGVAESGLFSNAITRNLLVQHATSSSIGPVSRFSPPRVGHKGWRLGISLKSISS